MKMVKLFALSLTLLLTSCMFSACGGNSVDNSKNNSSNKDSSSQSESNVESSKTEQVIYEPQNGVQVYSVPKGAPESKDFTVIVNEMPVGLYSTETLYESTDTFGYFDLIEGTANITVKPNFSFQSCEVLPKSRGITPEIKNGEIKFSTDKIGDLTLIFNGNYKGKVLQIFINPEDVDAPTESSPTVTYIGPGYYTRRELNVLSGETLYIAGGAYIEDGTIGIGGRQNVTVRGRGVISQGSKDITQAVFFGGCKNVKLEGIICNKRYTGWSGQILNCDGVTVERYRVVSPVLYSTDGLNIVCSKNVTYKNCYFRTGDDCVSIKGGNNDKPSTEPVDNILIEDCIFWSDGNNAVAIGSETYTPYMRNITVRNSEILYVKDNTDNRGAMAIICLHGTDISNILFENINVGPCGYLTSIFYTEEIFEIPGNLRLPGEIHDVTFRNITQRGGDNPKFIRLSGWNEEKKIRNVTYDNVTVEGVKIHERYPSVSNKFIENIIYK